MRIWTRELISGLAAQPLTVIYKPIRKTRVVYGPPKTKVNTQTRSLRGQTREISVRGG
jgi:hypothetical protein